MRGEHGGRGDRLERGVELEAVGHQLAAALEHGERRVALVDVPHGWRQAERAQRTHAAHAEHQLLAHPRLLIAAVELVGDHALGLGVLRHLGVEQIGRDAPHARLPDPQLRPAILDLDADAQLLAALVPHHLQWQVLEAAGPELVDLVAFPVDVLVEVSLAIEEPDRDERQPEIARRLAVVAGEYPEPARVEPQALVEAVLRTEVGDQILLAVELALDLGGQAVRQIGLEARERPPIEVHERGVVGGLLEPPLRDAPQQHAGVVADGVPEAVVERAEERAHLAVPRVEEVVRELRQALERLGNARAHLQSEQSSRHGFRFCDYSSMLVLRPHAVMVCERPWPGAAAVAML